MEIDAFFIEWYWLIAGIIIVLSLFVMELRDRGHFHLKRDLTRSEACCACFIMGFPCFGALLGLALYFLYLSMGSPAFMDGVFDLFFFLYRFSGIALVSIMFAILLKEVHKSWGIMGLSALVTILFSFIYVLGYSGAPQEFYADVLLSYMPMIVLFSIVEWPIQGILLGFLSGKINPKELAPHTSQHITHHYPEKTISMIHHLAKRVVIDRDSASLEAILALRDKRPDEFKSAVTGLTYPDLGEHLTGDISNDTQELLLLLKKERPTRLTRIIGFSFPIWVSLLYAMIWTWDVIPRRTWLNFIWPLVFVFFLMVILKVASDSQGASGAVFRIVRNNESFLLTDQEFRQRCLLNRVVYVILTTVFLITLFVHYTILSPTMTIPFYGVAVTYLITVPLALRDHMITGKRKRVDIVQRVLEKVPEDDEDEVSLMPPPSRSPDEWSDLYPSMQERKPSTSERPMSSSSQTSEVSPALNEFLKRLERPSFSVYEEQKMSNILMGVSIGSLLSIAITWTITITGPSSFPLVVPIVATVIGIPATLIAAAMWYFAIKKYGIRGLGRHTVSAILSAVEIDSNGIENIGYVAVPSTPEEFKGLGFRPRIGYGTLARKMGPDVTWPRAKLEGALQDYRKMNMRITLLAGSLLTAIGLFLVIVFGGGMDASALVPFALLAFGIVLLLYSLYLRTRSKEDWVSTISLSDAVTLRETFDQIVQLIRSESKYCLRLLVVGQYDNLYYTGRIFMTTANIELKEAVIVPEHY
ncbi:MAG: hypothetical protein K9W43_13960 [Candidatus Thorarchaeota archaeon]|nr:hypothetical protein [Candidatus Thorarchaeota archaeon]